MKFFSWLGAILILLLIIAAITVPGDQKFNDFITKEKDGDTMSCKPIIGKSTGVKLLVKILSINTVSYCEINKAPFRINDKKNGEAKTLNYIIPKITYSETYLGLFGRFWKI